MIKPEELRLGNWINFIDDGVDFQVTEIKLNNPERHSTINGLLLDWIQPIPLTEEWLLRMGFVRGKEDTDRNVYYGKGKQLFDIMFNTKGYLLYKTVVVHTPIEYVHQMQNLIYALTGTELTIKP